MYNYYIDLKKKEEEQKKEENLKKEENDKIKRKSKLNEINLLKIEKMDLMINNYDNRIKKFIFQIAEKPIIVKKKNPKDCSTREAYYQENSDKILFTIFL